MAEIAEARATRKRTKKWINETTEEMARRPESEAVQEIPDLQVLANETAKAAEEAATSITARRMGTQATTSGVAEDTTMAVLGAFGTVILFLFVMGCKVIIRLLVELRRMITS